MNGQQQQQESDVRQPGYRVAYNINPEIVAKNIVDENGNPAGGSVNLRIGENRNPLRVQWQDGPRGTGETNADGSPILLPPNGAFVEDVIYAALQRLEFFNDGKYRDRANSIAISFLESALWALKDRQLERSHRGVEGKHAI